ncbi:unnamed protein product [Linum tenue]|uniref:Ubiquitin-like protease family profile domain-containing protein n=2 Tax=Linum tenue TaxID=586396 RepID=A0AAV0MJ73_9ROSI|nr:unnamed protein product [Linum tenue]
MRTRKAKRPGGIDCPIDLESEPESPLSVSDGFIPVSKHRTCWKHMAAFLHERKTKISKRRLRRLQLTSKCFSGTFPSRLRSNRGAKRKSGKADVTQEGVKLDTAQFDCYFSDVWSRLSEDKKSSFAYLESLWFYMYMLPGWKGKAIQWIRDRAIFNKRYVIVPIVLWGHWSLLILCNLGESLESENGKPCMLLLDSLENAGPGRIEPDLRKFLLDIYRSEGRAVNKKLIHQIPLLIPKVPQQRDDVECGKFVLYFIHLFVRDAPESFSLGDYPYFMNRTWFTPDCLQQFFEELDLVKKAV